MSIATAIAPDADRDLERRVVSFLRGRHMPGLRHIQVEARDGIVTLRGRVSSFYEKQVSQLCCQRVAGVLKLVDGIVVAAAG
jgi:osmotically-inducible protein OsmY